MRRLKATLQRIDGFDLLALVGLGLLAWGLWLVYEPLAPIVTGIIILAAVVQRAARQEREAQNGNSDKSSEARAKGER